jgi:DNA-binding transcriptional MerR regulator
MERYRLAGLAAASGISQRTIRYYITEGLLPPPVGVGPSAAYTAAHRDRLALIARLKERYLPLRAIAEHLKALDDQAVRVELATPAIPAAPAPQEKVSAAHPPAVPVPASAPPHDLWTRVVLADGVELHVRADRLRQPVPLDALVQQARRLLGEEE